jgi:hypothetical protein
MDPWKMIVFGGLHLMGWGCVGFAAVTLRQMERARTWPQSSGTISKSTTRRDDGGTRPEIEFRYVVEGREYVGDDPILGGFATPNWSSRPAERIVARYPVGSPVLVRYDPSDPRRACLELGTSVPALAFAVMGLAFVVFGAFGAWAGWKGL